MKLKNKSMIQSYLVTTARYDFSVYEKRILYRLVEICQCVLEGQTLKSGFKISDIHYEQLKEVIMPVSAFLKDEQDENYVRIKNALLGLRNKVIEIDDERSWRVIGIIEMPELLPNGYVKFILHKEIFEALLNFSKGFRKYELTTAMRFESIYAMRFYELLSGKKEPITYKIEDLKIMFKVEGKYKLNADFIRYIVELAKKEMDNKSPFSFTYKPNKVGKKIISLTFFPYEISQNKDEELYQKEIQKRTSIYWDLDRLVVNYLKENYNFDDDEIKHNREIFKEAQIKLDLLSFLAKKRSLVKGKINPKGYLINALKKEIKKEIK